MSRNSLLVAFFTRYNFLLRQDAILHWRASCLIQFFVGYVVLLCLAVVAVVAVAVYAHPPHKSFFDRNSRDLQICRGNQPELILQRTYSEKELSFKVICEKLPTLFSRHRGGGGGGVTNQIAGLISVNYFSITFRINRGPSNPFGSD